MKFFVRVACINRGLDVGAALDHDVPTGVFKWNFYHCITWELLNYT